MVGSQGQVKLAKVAKKSFTYDVTHNNPHPQPKKLFSSANYKTCHIFWHFDQVHNLYRSGDIPTQSESGCTRKGQILTILFRIKLICLGYRCP